MASIDEYLEQILEARYGRDVRQSIHDGIKKCYEDGRAQPSSWGTLDGKPFEGIGTGLSVDEEGNLNAEGEAIPDNVAYLGEETIPSTPTPRDADTLGGYEPSHYATKNEINDINDKLTNITSYTVDDGITVSKVGGAVYFAFVKNEYDLVDGTTICILPEEYRPASYLSVPFISSNSVINGRLVIAPNGTVNYYGVSMIVKPRVQINYSIY